MTVQIVDLVALPNEDARRTAEEVASRLSSETVAEMASVHGLEPRECLIASLPASTHCWAILDGERPVAIFGAFPGTLASTGVLWLVTTEGAECLRRFAQEAVREQLAQLSDCYDYAIACVKLERTGAQRWLQRLGFETIGLREGVGFAGQTYVVLGSICNV